MACQKTEYDTRAKAHEAIAGFNNDPRPWKLKRTVHKSYRCPDCGKWHLASLSTQRKGKNKNVSKDLTLAVKKVNGDIREKKTLHIKNFTSKPIR